VDLDFQGGCESARFIASRFIFSGHEIISCKIPVRFDLSQ